MSNITIKQSKASSYGTNIKISGNPEEVLAEAKKMIDNDNVTPMYEHMALRVCDMCLDDYPESITVTLYKNLYAGD